MSTATEDRVPDERPVVLRDEELGAQRCRRCNLSYVAHKSTSALRLTYCSFLCELGDLGFSIAGLEHMELQRNGAASTQAPEPERPALAAAR